MNAVLSFCRYRLIKPQRPFQTVRKSTHGAFYVDTMAGEGREFLNSAFGECLTVTLTARVFLLLDVAQGCAAREASGNKGNTRCML